MSKKYPDGYKSVLAKPVSETRTYHEIMDHAVYMLRYTDPFIAKVFEGEDSYIRSCLGMVAAHGDKVSQYKTYWEERGLDFKKAQIIYFLTYTKLLDRPKHESKQWVAENYSRYENLLP